MGKGFVSSEMAAARASAHGKIATINNGFKLANGNPFSITIIPKASIAGRLILATENVGLLVNCKLYQDDDFSDYPMTFNWPTEAAIIEIAANAIDLATYDVYWGCGNEAIPA